MTLVIRKEPQKEQKQRSSLTWVHGTRWNRTEKVILSSVEMNN